MHVKSREMTSVASRWVVVDGENKCSATWVRVLESQWEGGPSQVDEGKRPLILAKWLERVDVGGGREGATTPFSLLLYYLE